MAEALSVLRRVRAGKDVVVIEELREGVYGKLLEWVDWAKAAYNERLETGDYDPVRERHDLATAFLQECHALGVSRREAKKLWRRWF